jgi:hypothetical protein
MTRQSERLRRVEEDMRETVNSGVGECKRRIFAEFGLVGGGTRCPQRVDWEAGEPIALGATRATFQAGLRANESQIC